MKITIICFLLLMNAIGFEAVAESAQHKADSLLFEVIHKSQQA